MKELIKKSLSAFLAVVLIVCITACGANKIGIDNAKRAQYDESMMPNDSEIEQSPNVDNSTSTSEDDHSNVESMMPNDSEIEQSPSVDNSTSAAERTLPNGEVVISFSELPSVDIHNYTEESSTEIIKDEQKIVTQIESMQSMASDELAAISNTAESNPNRLPVVVEIVFIGDDITYIYTFAEGENETACLVKSNIHTGLETYEPDVSADIAGRDKLNQDAEIGGGSGSRGVSGSCNGPCTISGNDIPNGLGVRLPMTKSGVKLSFSLTTSGTDTRPSKNSSGAIVSYTKNGETAIAENYLYGGFTSTLQGTTTTAIADLGLVYQTLSGTTQYAWKPFFALRYGTTYIGSPNYNTSDGVNGPGQVWYKNGYILGGTVQVETRIDTQTNGNSTVVLKTQGYAYHATSNGDGINTWLVQLAYYNMDKKIATPSSWRVLAHPAIPEQVSESQIASAYVSGTFDNLRVDGQLPTFGTPDRDYGYYVNNGNGNWYLQSCKGMGIYY